MGDLTKNISRHEVACHCNCGVDTIDVETADVVQTLCNDIAKEFGVDKVIVTILSGHRCFKYNRKPASEGGPGSNDESQHPQGRALDFRIEGIPPYIVSSHLHDKYPNKYGIGTYSTFTHLDTRSNGPARWIG